jgi:Response regulator containing CheY-like receiver domain and AraC-type DNA-binding domain
MIVDDEILTRIGIASMHKWSENGYEIVGEADNGKSALEMARLKEPDIILTDIKMPVMNGIELIKEARNLGLKSRFVILSAYSEFEYVREGMKLGAEDYLLKLELEPDKLIELLNRISEKIRKENDITNTSNPSKKIYRVSEKHTKAKCIYNILKGNYYTPDEIEMALKRSGLNIKQENLVCIVVQNLQQTGIQPSGKSMLHFPIDSAIFKALNELVENYGTGYGCVIEKDIYGFIVSLNNSVTPAFSIEYYLRIKTAILEHIKNTFNISLKIILSDPFNNFTEIPLLFNKMINQIKNRSNAVTLNTVNSQNENLNFPFSDELSRIDTVLSNTNIDEFEKSFNSLINRIKEHGSIPSRVLHGICQTLIHIMDSFMIKNNYLGHNWNRSEELMYLIKNCKTQEQYISYIQSLNKKLSQYVNFDNYKAVILKAKKYIEQNYQKDITLESTALHVNLSPVYFSRLFSRETGVSFIDYLTMQRICHAKDYLKNTNKRVQEISNLIGYNNPYYFSRIFKKVTGVTPLEYRK